MTTRLIIAVLLAFAAVPAAAMDVADCDQMTLVDDAEADAFAAPAFGEAVVPCAVVESGLMGPDCQDAPFYVVSQNGTLLCRVDLALLTHGTSTPIVEQAPAAPASSSGFAAVAAVAPTLLALPTPPLARTLSSSSTEPSLGPSDAHLFERLRPS